MPLLNPFIPKPPYSLKTAAGALVLAAVFACSMFGGYAAYGATERRFNCGDHKSMLLKLLGQEHEAYLGTGLEDHKFAISIFVGLRSGNWAILGVDNKNDSACVLLSGTEFGFAIIRGA